VVLKDNEAAYSAIAWLDEEFKAGCALPDCLDAIA